jgi:hypothetical protein
MDGEETSKWIEDVGKLSQLSKEDLIEKFEYAVRYWHRPHHMIQPEFSLEDLRYELLKRLKELEDYVDLMSADE